MLRTTVYYGFLWVCIAVLSWKLLAVIVAEPGMGGATAEALRWIDGWGW